VGSIVGYALDTWTLVVDCPYEPQINCGSSEVTLMFEVYKKKQLPFDKDKITLTTN